MITWKQFSQNVLGNTPAQQYLTPSSTFSVIHAVSLWNPTAAPVTVAFYIVPVNGAETDATTVESITVSAGKSLPVPNLINHKLVAGMSIWAVGAGVTCTISGAEEVPN